MTNNYTEMTLAELRAILRTKNVPGYSSMRKAEMVALLEKMDAAETPAPVEAPKEEPKSV